MAAPCSEEEPVKFDQYLYINTIIQKRYKLNTVGPELIGFYSEESQNPDKDICDNQDALSALKYQVKLSPPKDLIISNDVISTFVGIPRNRSRILDWVSKHANEDAVRDARFVSDWTVLHAIMNMKSCSLYATVCGAKIIIYTDKHVYGSGIERAVNKHIFVDKPTSKTIIISNRPNEKTFSEVYKLKIGDASIIYSAAIPGVHSEHQVNSLEELKEVEHVVTAVKDVSDNSVDSKTLLVTKPKLLEVSKHTFDALATVFSIHRPKPKFSIEQHGCTIGICDDFRLNILEDLLVYIQDVIENSNLPESKENYTFKFYKTSADSEHVYAVAYKSSQNITE